MIVKKRKKQNILSKTLITIYLLLICFIVLYNTSEYYQDKKFILNDSKESLNNVMSLITHKVSDMQQYIEEMAKLEATTIKLKKFNKNELDVIIKSYLKIPYVADLAYINAPQNTIADYYALNKGAIIHDNLNTFYNKNYEKIYTYRDWYRIALSTKKPFWGDLSKSKGYPPGYGITYSYPIVKNGDVIGLLLYDISMDWMTDYLKTKLAKSYLSIYILSPTGEILAQTINSNDLMRLKTNVGFKPKSYKETVSGKFTYLCEPLFNKQCYIYLTHDNTETLASIRNILIYNIIIGLIVLLLTFVGVAVSLKISLKKIKQACLNLYRLSHNNFSGELTIKSHTKEINLLNDVMLNVQKNLKTYFTIFKDKTESAKEMMFARKMQFAILPQRNSIPVDTRYDVYWFLKPAKEVGGDFCNIRVIDENTLFISIGDVTGKGIPASFYTAWALTLENFATNKSFNLEEHINKMNIQISLNNRADLYISYLCMKLDLSSGKCYYANAGHSLPIYHKTNGTFEEFRKVKGTFLGISNKIKYTCGEIHLEDGDSFLLYTDGLNEARDISENIYGINKVKTIIANSANLLPKNIINRIYSDLYKFTYGRSQYDDICLLLFKYKGGQK